jgi:short-subunit dehydrogenase
MHLAGRVVLLTGGSHGIGPVIAERLAQEGAHLAIVARSPEALRAVAASLRALGVRALDIPADISRPDERDRLSTEVRSEFGRIDVLVNNAGVEHVGDFSTTPWCALREAIELNLSAPVHLAHTFLPSMLERREGHIINIASMSAKAGAPYDAIYSGTKGGLARWSEALRREIAGSGVGVSTIYPGYVVDRGMFARFGLQPPSALGSCSAADVADAVRDAIQRNLPEVIVNSRPIRPALALAELFPPAGDWMMRRMGVTALQRRKAALTARGDGH